MKTDNFDLAQFEILETIRIISDSKREHNDKMSRSDITNIVTNICNKYRIDLFSMAFSLGIA